MPHTRLVAKLVCFKCASSMRQRVTAELPPILTRMGSATSRVGLGGENSQNTNGLPNSAEVIGKRRVP